MGQYTGDSSLFNNSVYVYNIEDLVIGGSPLATSNIPIKNLTDNSSYIKKYKGRIIHGSGVPNSSTLSGFATDANTINNILYLDEATGAFWKPDDQSGSTWTNIYKSVVLNVAGMKINNNGNDAEYFSLMYDDVEKALVIKDHNDNYADVRVGKVSFKTLDASGNVDIAKIADNELLLLYGITQQSENEDGLFSIKRLEDISGVTVTGFEIPGDTGVLDNTFYTSGIDLTTVLSPQDFVQIRGIPENSGEIINGYYRVNNVVTNSFTVYAEFKPISADASVLSGLSGLISKDNSSIIKWDNTNQRYELVDRSGNLLPINLAGFQINGISSSFVPTRVISTKGQFDEIFVDNLLTGDNTVYLKKPETGYVDYIENEYIYIKPNSGEVDGHYDLGNYVQICKNNVKIETAPGVFIKYTSANSGFITKDDTDLNIDSYSIPDKSFEILSKNTYYVNGENDGRQIQISSGDILFSFSKTTEACLDHEVQSVIKNVTNTNIDVSNHTLTYETKLGSAYINNSLYYSYVSSGIVYIKKTSFNSGTNSYTNNTLLGDTNAYTAADTDISVDGTYKYVVIKETDIRARRSLIDDVIASGFSAASFTNSNSHSNIKSYTYSGKIYVLATSDTGNNLKLFFATFDSDNSFSSQSVVTVDTSIDASTKFDIISDGTYIYISYCKDNQLHIKRTLLSDIDFETTGEYEEITELETGDISAGNYSKLLYHDSKIRIAYTAVITSTDNDEIRYAEISSSYSLENISSLISPYFPGEGDFRDLDIKVNENNEFESEMFQVIGFNNNSGTGSGDIFLSQSTDGGQTWNTTFHNISSGATSNRGKILTTLNDYLFINYLDNSGTENKIARLEYNLHIVTDKSIVQDIWGNTVSDIVLGHYPIKGIELIISIDGDNISQTEILKLGNTSFDCRYNIKTKNTNSAYGINFSNKTFYNNLECTIINDNNNNNDNNIYGFNHGTINNTYIEKSSIIGSKNLNDCSNINYIGFIDGHSNIANGNFDE